MKDIYYINNKGERLDLLAPPYLLQTAEIFNYEWDYESVESSAVSSRITGFSKKITERPFTLSILNYSRESYEAAINRFFETVEYDVLNKTPGKLYIGDQYQRCYFIASEKTGWEYDIELIDNDGTYVVERPFWITEQQYAFKPSSGEPLGGYLDFPFDVPFDLTGDATGIGNIQIDHYADCNFLITVYGPCTNPRISIGGNIYEVETKLDAGEYLQIDSINGSVFRTKVGGQKVNEMNNRAKGYELFKLISPGYNVVSWDGSFGFDITIYIERSEPKW